MTRIAIRVRPGARTRGATGWREGPSGSRALQVSVREPAEDGRANRAVIELIAELVGVPRAEVEIVRGAGSRDKVVSIGGLDEDVVLARLERALETEKE